MSQGFTNQEKLALALTSAGSMRNLAALVGISHQKLGRWLREGEQGGVKSIPSDSLTNQAINQAFKIHQTFAREQSKVYGIPFDARFPVYATRKPLKTGLLGDRVFVEHTQFIHKDTRTKVIKSLANTERFYAATIESNIDLVAYAEALADDEHKTFSDTRKKRYKKDELTRDILNSIVATIGAKERYRPLYTRRQSIAPGTNIKDSLDEINRLLREKMEPASDFGNGLAKTYVLQLLPLGYEKHKPKSKAAPIKKAATRARNVRTKPGK